MPLIQIPTRQIVDWPSFHQVFAQTMGFPEFYGKNMNAWIDCMTSLNSTDDGMTTVHCVSPDVVVLQLQDVQDFKSRCQEIYDALIECSAFVNFRKIEVGEPAVLALSFSK